MSFEGSRTCSSHELFSHDQTLDIADRISNDYSVSLTSLNMFNSKMCMQKLMPSSLAVSDGQFYKSIAKSRWDFGVSSVAEKQNTNDYYTDKIDLVECLAPVISSSVYPVGLRRDGEEWHPLLQRKQFRISKLDMKNCFVSSKVELHVP